MSANVSAGTATVRVSGGATAWVLIFLLAICFASGIANTALAGPHSNDVFQGNDDNQGDDDDQGGDGDDQGQGGDGQSRL